MHSYNLIFQSNDNDLEVGIDSIVAIPIDQWSLDYVTPQLECVRKNGNCIPTAFPNAPGPADRALIPFSSGNQPEWVVIDGNSAVPDVNGRVPNPGMYILVAQYKQKNQGNRSTSIKIYKIQVKIILLYARFFILQKSPSR